MRSFIMYDKPEIIFNSDKVDIKKIMEQIHENMKSRGYDIEEMKKLSRPLQIKSAKQAHDASAPIFGAVAGVSATSNVQYWWPIPPQGGIKGKLRVFLNKVMRKLTYFYVKHVFDQQNIFNANVSNSLSVLANAYSELKSENTELLMRMSAVSNENAQLKNLVQKMNLEMKQIIEGYKQELEIGINETLAGYEKKFADLDIAYAQRQNRLDSLNTAVAARLHRVEEMLLSKNTPQSGEALMETSAELSAVGEAFDTNGKHDFDYFLFESKFRGSKEEIKKRQAHYIEYFRGRQNVLDIGCGRGEFLELLAENGIKGRGVDILPENIRCCEEAGVDAVLGDGIKYLRSCEDNSLGGIFCAQVIEHISTEQLVELVRLAYKKLEKGACLVLETLNPKCLMIYAECFYLDPSHTKPVHPEAVKFIAECENFVENELIYMTPSDEKVRIPLIPQHEEFDNAINTLNNLIYGNREYALVARK